MDPLPEYVKILLSSVGGAIAGAWILWRFVRSRSGYWNLQLTMTPVDHPLPDGNRLLVVVVTMTNIGKVVVRPSDTGCRLTVRAIPAAPAIGLPLSFGTSPTIVNDFDLLKRWWRDDVGYANYEIEPGCEYRESFAVAVRADELLELEVVFHWAGYIWPPVYDLRRRQLRWRETDRLVEYAIYRTAKSTSPALASSGVESLKHVGAPEPEPEA